MVGGNPAFVTKLKCYPAPIDGSLGEEAIHCRRCAPAGEAQRHGAGNRQLITDHVGSSGRYLVGIVSDEDSHGPRN